MKNSEAIAKIEGIVECDDEQDYLNAWQHIVDTGIVWTLEHRFEHVAQQLLEAGIIRPPGITIH